MVCASRLSPLQSLQDPAQLCHCFPVPRCLPLEDDDGECYCPNCGVLPTDENCLKAEDLDSLPPRPRPTLLEVLVEHLTAARPP
jgi:hypothetical protein